MSDIRRNDKKESETIVHFQGRPKKSNKKEFSRWRRFIETIMPYLKRKRELADDYLIAKVDVVKAEAFKKKSEGINEQSQAMLNIANARKIEAETEKLIYEKESYKSKGIVFDKSYNDFEKDLSAIIDKINKLNDKHGTKFIFLEKRLTNEFPPDESKANDFLANSPVNDN